MTYPVRYALGFVALGILLFLLGGMLSGMAEGSFAAFAIFGSPWTLVPWQYSGFLGPVVVWSTIGVTLMLRRWGLAKLLLLMNCLAAPAAVYFMLRMPGDWAEDWRRIQLTCYDSAGWCLLFLVPYLAGHVIAWRIVIRQRQAALTGAQLA